MRQTVVSIHEYNDRVAAERLGNDPWIVFDMGKDPDIRAKLEERLQRILRVAGLNGNLDTRMALVETRQHLGDVIGAFSLMHLSWRPIARAPAED